MVTFQGDWNAGITKNLGCVDICIVGFDLDIKRTRYIRSIKVTKNVMDKVTYVLCNCHERKLNKKPYSPTYLQEMMKKVKER